MEQHGVMWDDDVVRKKISACHLMPRMNDLTILINVMTKRPIIYGFEICMKPRRKGYLLPHTIELWTIYKICEYALKWIKILPKDESTNTINWQEYHLLELQRALAVAHLPNEFYSLTCFLIRASFQWSQKYYRLLLSNIQNQANRLTITNIFDYHCNWWWPYPWIHRAEEKHF